MWCVDAAPRGIAAFTSTWPVRPRNRARPLGACSDVSDDVGHGEWKKCAEEIISPSLWRRVYCGRVNALSVPIHLKESEGAPFVAEHLVRSGNGGQGQRHLVLGDSMKLSYVFGKGRACDSRLLAVARKWSCISIAGDLLLVYRWIPSEFNVADADSGRGGE